MEKFYINFTNYTYTYVYMCMYIYFWGVQMDGWIEWVNGVCMHGWMDELDGWMHACTDR